MQSGSCMILLVWGKLRLETSCRTLACVSASCWNLETNLSSSSFLMRTFEALRGFCRPRNSSPKPMSINPINKRIPVNKANAYGVPIDPGIPSRLTPKSPVIVERTSPQPPKIARLCVTRRLLSCKKLYLYVMKERAED